jgi:hypothetical protein
MFGVITVTIDFRLTAIHRKVFSDQNLTTARSNIFFGEISPSRLTVLQFPIACFIWRPRDERLQSSDDILEAIQALSDNAIFENLQMIFESWLEHLHWTIEHWG